MQEKIPFELQQKLMAHR